MKMDRSDAILLEVIARELDKMGEGQSAYSSVAMMAQLLRTVGSDRIDLSPAPARDIDAHKLRSYLAKKKLIEESDHIEVLRSTLGFSKDTYMIAVKRASVDPWVIVIRRNQPAGSTRTTVVDEFPLLRDIFAFNFPVAEPLLLEPDPSVFGQPFMLSMGVSGEADFVVKASEAREREQAARDLATFLATLHALDISKVHVKRTVGDGEPVEELKAYFAEWRGYWEECAPADYPDVPAMFDLVMPDFATVRDVCLVHSDIGFHNILVDEGHITAVVDWEFAHLGEAEEDLAYCRESVERLVPWETFLDYYREAGGREPSQDRLKAYGLWRHLRNATCCALGREAFAQGLNNDLRLAFAGRIILEQSVRGLRSLPK